MTEGFYLIKSCSKEGTRDTSKNRAFGSAITNTFEGIQNTYSQWISNSGGGGNLAQRLPNFSTGEHLIYEDYQIIGRFTPDVLLILPKFTFYSSKSLF